MRWLIISLVTLLLGFLNIFSPIRSSFQYVLNPVQFGINRFAKETKGGVTFFTTLREIYESNQQLKQLNIELQERVFELEEKEAENELLKEQLGVDNPVVLEKEFVLAQVFGNSQDSSGTSLLLDKGSYHEVSPGDIVIQGNYLVGIVKSVTGSRSIVEILTSSDISVSAVDFRTKTEGLVRGQFGTSIEMQRILPGEDVGVGDLIVTSGKAGIYIPGLIIGEVKSVEEDSAKVLKKASLDSFLDYGSLDKVFVVLSK